EFYYKNNKIYKDMKEKININKYDITHAHSLFENGYLAYKAKKEFGIDYIVAIRNTDVNGYFKRAKHLRKIGIEIMKNAKRIIFISPSYKDLVLKTYVPSNEIDFIKNKCEVIANGIDSYWIKNLNNNQKELKDKLEVRLIQACRIDKNKNIYTSIEICKELRKRGIKSYLDVIGEGPEKKNLINKSKDIDYIKFYNRANKEELIKHYDNNDIFIMPSKYETFGLVYPEAMSRGLPIVYTKGQGFDKFFKDGEVGYPIEYNNIKEGVEAIINIINDYKNVSNNSKEYSKIFDWRLMADKYKKIYSE
ncbi:glycosyltransferase family 4 protein, partial [Clostridium sp.]|uniref:glycosyltransferase family 4 protein n=1 Tax=Clostridium sp. TaxID=1506 RepID=UPI00261608F5